MLRLASRAHGIGTAKDLADYYRMQVRAALPRLGELVEGGELHVVRVEGWREPAYLHSEAKLPRTIAAASLLSPFDPLIWCRPRTKRLFDFDYRLEIYTPAEKRRWGYYVLPFLLNDRVVARVDLKANREASTLQVLAAYQEPHAKPAAVVRPLASELKTMATWLNLKSVKVNRPQPFREIPSRQNQITKYQATNNGRGSKCYHLDSRP